MLSVFSRNRQVRAASNRLYPIDCVGVARTASRPATEPSGRGSILGGGVEQDVRFTHLDADDGDHSDIDAAYRDKYRRYEEKIVATVVGPASHAVTLRVDAETLDG